MHIRIFPPRAEWFLVSLFSVGCWVEKKKLATKTTQRKPRPAKRSRMCCMRSWQSRPSPGTPLKGGRKLAKTLYFVIDIPRRYCVAGITFQLQLLMKVGNSLIIKAGIKESLEELSCEFKFFSTHQLKELHRCLRQNQ